MFENSPKPPSQNGPCLMLLRPRARRQLTGMAYEMYRNTKHPVTMLQKAEISVLRVCIRRKSANLLNAVVDAMYKHPRTATHVELIMWALSGTSVSSSKCQSMDNCWVSSLTRTEFGVYNRPISRSRHAAVPSKRPSKARLPCVCQSDTLIECF